MPENCGRLLTKVVPEQFSRSGKSSNEFRSGGHREGNH